MNLAINHYKGIVLAIVVVLGLGVTSATFAVCSPCQAAAAAREAARQAAEAAKISARDAAIQATLIAGKPVVGREVELDELDSTDMTFVEACCTYCAETGKFCGGQNSARCATCQAELIKQSVIDALETQSIADALATVLAATAVIAKKRELVHDEARAPREALANPCDVCGLPSDTNAMCVLSGLLQGLISSEAACCALINAKLDAQGKAAGKCCKNLKHELVDIGELVESQLDQSATCCSVIETTLTSVLDQSATCCSLVDSTLTSVLDQSAACCSLLDTTLTSVLDQSATCCSALEVQIVNLSLSVTDIVVTLQSVLDICLG